MSLIDKELLKSAMRDVGIKPTPLALSINRDKDYIRDFLTGRKASLKLEDAQKIADELGKPLSALTGGRTDDLSAPGMEVVGKVAAGLYRDISVEDQDGDRPRILFSRDMRFPHAHQYALEVVGDSMNEYVADGGFVVCVNLLDSGVRLSSGMVVHVEKSVMGGQFIETTLKEVRREPNDTIMLFPRSSNPSHKPFPAKGSSGDEIIIKGVVIGRWEPEKFSF